VLIRSFIRDDTTKVKKKRLKSQRLDRRKIGEKRSENLKGWESKSALKYKSPTQYKRNTHTLSSHSCLRGGYPTTGPPVFLISTSRRSDLRSADQQKDNEADFSDSSEGMRAVVPGPTAAARRRRPRQRHPLRPRGMLPTLPLQARTARKSIGMNSFAV